MQTSTSGGPQRAHGAARSSRKAAASGSPCVRAAFAAPRRPQATMYDLAMTIYFGMYGAVRRLNNSFVREREV